MKILFVVFAAAVAVSLSMNNASAHRFNVALVIARSGPSAVEGNEIRDGFMIATKERDAHPNEESDGHLGGLDVYVHRVDLQDKALTALRSLLAREAIDIVVVFGSDPSSAAIRSSIADFDMILLKPGRTHFPSSTAPQSHAVQAFIDAFEQEHGYPPTSHAAQGYNAARRIDMAVRAFAGVSDKVALRQALEKTESGIDW